MSQMCYRCKGYIKPGTGKTIDGCEVCATCKEKVGRRSALKSIPSPTSTTIEPFVFTKKHLVIAGVIAIALVVWLFMRTMRGRDTRPINPPTATAPAPNPE